MSISHAFDASTPPTRPFPGCQAAFGYIGGDTPHAWTVDEWNMATANGELRAMPIWVAVPGMPADQQAHEAAKAAVGFGWKAHAMIRRAIAFDSEALEDSAIIRAFAHVLRLEGFEPVDYRSAEAMFADPSGCLEWVAHWNVNPGPFTRYQVAFQYAHDLPWAGTLCDLSAFSDELWPMLGRGLRRYVP